MRKALIITLMILAVPLSYAAQSKTYPPKNAAVLYYKFLYYYPSSDAPDKIIDYARGEIELDEEIVAHLDKFQHVIKELTVAGDIKSCNWGIDFSHGLATIIPGLSEFKRCAYLLVADARRLASKGDYYEAIDRCVSAEKLASHVSGNTLINSLVGAAISGLSDKCIAHIIPETKGDKVKLHYLRSQIDRFDNRIERMKTGLLSEKQLFGVLFDKTSPYRLNYEKLKKDVDFELEKSDSKVKKEMIEKIKADDGAFLDNSLKYNLDVLDDAAAAFDKPYKQAYEILSKKMVDKLEKDAREKPEALLSWMYMPAISKCYKLGVRSQNSLNALKTALEIFIVKAKTGKLPKTLPANTPKDLYTGKQMVYEITDDGFILRCLGTDTKKDKERDTYIFKVKK